MCIVCFLIVKLVVLLNCIGANTRSCKMLLANVVSFSKVGWLHSIGYELAELNLLRLVTAVCGSNSISNVFSDSTTGLLCCLLILNWDQSNIVILTSPSAFLITFSSNFSLHLTSQINSSQIILQKELPFGNSFH